MAWPDIEHVDEVRSRFICSCWSAEALLRLVHDDQAGRSSGICNQGRRSGTRRDVDATLLGTKAITSRPESSVEPTPSSSVVMVGAAGKEISRCLMTVAYVDKATTRAKDWPADVSALFLKTRCAGRGQGARIGRPSCDR